jgi:hypothetical protein
MGSYYPRTAFKNTWPHERRAGNSKCPVFSVRISKVPALSSSNRPLA